MSALSTHSPAKRNKTNTSGWQTPFPDQPELVAEPVWECPQNECGGGLALKLHRNGKDKFVVCTKQVCKDPTTCHFACSFFRPSKDNPHIWTKTPISSAFFGVLVCFFGFGTEIRMLARTTRNCPGRMNTSPEQETSIIYVTYAVSYTHLTLPTKA